MNKDLHSILLVEGSNDKYFFEALLKYLKVPDSRTDVNSIVEYPKIGGCDIKSITNALSTLKTDLRNKPVERLGIILDIDDSSVKDRIHLINDAVNNSSISEFGIPIFSAENQSVVFKVNEYRSITFNIYFIKDKNGKGNLESLLQSIITVEPLAADCLEQWKKCAEANKRSVKQSDFLKEWIKFYLRYDYCNPRELNRHVSDNCTVEKSLTNMSVDDKPKAWNFESDLLDDLKKYLSNFL